LWEEGHSKQLDVWLIAKESEGGRANNGYGWGFIENRLGLGLGLGLGL
jgi:hypothetical protein